MRKLYFGDCLDILKSLDQEHPGGFIDLIYIDPPFNSKRDYNVLFESHDLVGDSNAQKQAFADTWSNVSYLDTLNEIQSLDLDLHQFLTTLDGMKSISKSAVSYLTTMAIRIYYMQRVLKDTGSFYLHCDPTMSHYLKLACDIVFGSNNFQSEIIWKRSASHGGAVSFNNVHDVILYLSKGDSPTWNSPRAPYDQSYIESHYSNVDDSGRRYQLVSAHGAGAGPARRFGDKLLKPPANRHWMSQENIDKLMSANRIVITRSGMPRIKRYLDDTDGVPLNSIWDDIFPINSQAQERLGYPTQKPEALLDRIISASSNEGDLVADFFCGCGTTIASAERLNRSWIGVDISHLAIRLIVDRLTKPYPDKAKQQRIRESIEISGLPKDIASAKELARGTEGGRLAFQDWVIEVLLGGVSNTKKTADGGFDGYMTFSISEKVRELVLIEVKSGNVNVKNIREFIEVVEARKAAIGVFVCFDEQVTKPMLHEAKKQGYYDEATWGQSFDKIQIITVEDLLAGEGLRAPESTRTTFKAAKLKPTKSSPGNSLFDK